MQQSSNLAYIIHSRRQREAPLLDFDNLKGKESRLVDALVGERSPTQTKVMRALYAEPSKKNNTAFRQLHYRVVGKLLNNLYFLDHTDPRYSVSRRYQLKCLDLLHKGTILYLEGDSAMSARVCKQCLDLAKADGFTSYGIEAAKQLRTVYAQTKQAKKFHAVVEDLKQLQALRNLEEQAEASYAEIVLALSLTITERHNSADTIGPLFEKLREIHQLAQSPSTADMLYKAELTYIEQSGDYLGMIQYCQEAEQRLAAGYFNPHRFDQRFNLFMKMYGYLLTQQPEKGLEVVEQAEKHFHPTSLNWMYFRENHLTLALHANQFDVARSVLDMALANPIFTRQYAWAQQRWEIYSAMLDFVHPLAKPSQAQRRKRTHLGLVVPAYSRDKRGLNVAILISQCLYFLQEGDREAVSLRVESLRKYRLRYLREAIHERTRLFLRLLELMADEQFDPQRCEERAAPILLQILATPPPKTSFVEVEIMPYPALWKIIVQHLRSSASVPIPLGKPQLQ